MKTICPFFPSFWSYVLNVSTIYAIQSSFSRFGLRWKVFITDALRMLLVLVAGGLRWGNKCTEATHSEKSRLHLQGTAQEKVATMFRNADTEDGRGASGKAWTFSLYIFTSILHYCKRRHLWDMHWAIWIKVLLSHEDDLCKDQSSAPPATRVMSSSPLASASSCDEDKSQVMTKEIHGYRSFKQWSPKEASSVQGSCQLYAQRGLFLVERICLPRALH